MTASCKTLRVKVLGRGDVQVHDALAISSFEELDAWLIKSVDRKRAFDIFCRQSGVRQPVTEETFDHLMCAEKPTFYVLLDGTPEAAIERELIGELRFELEMRDGGLGEAALPEAVLTWDVPDDAIDSGISGYKVTIIDECYGRQRQDHILIEEDVPLPTGGRKSCNFYIQEATKGSVCRAEVSVNYTEDWRVVGEAALPVRPSTVRFVQEELLRPRTPEADRHWEACAEDLSREVEKFCGHTGRSPRFLVLGKQHHGKSTMLNTLRRFIQRDTHVLDATRAAPPGELETTMRTESVEANFEFKEAGSRCLRFLDVPAITNMDSNRKKDLKVLLKSSPTDWGRGDRNPLFAGQHKADGAILVVSLESLAHERETLSDYFKELTKALKEEGCPYVVAATHRDRFLVQAGNDGKDPLKELEAAIEDLRRITNTQQVFAVGKIEKGSFWNVKVDRQLGELLAQLVHDARKRGSSGYTRATCASLAMCFVGTVALGVCHGL